MIMCRQLYIAWMRRENSPRLIQTPMNADERK